MSKCTHKLNAHNHSIIDIFYQLIPLVSTATSCQNPSDESMHHDDKFKVKDANNK